MFGTSHNKLRLDKLKENDTFKLKSEYWKVVEVGFYDWKADGESVEYLIKSKTGEEAFLEVEFYKGAYEIYFSKNIFIEAHVLEAAFNDEMLVYSAKQYELDECYTGAYKNSTKGGSWENLSIRMYALKKEILTIECWEDATYEAFLGAQIKSKEIKDLNRK
jgi:hypothetical protein